MANGLYQAIGKPETKNVFPFPVQNIMTQFQEFKRTFSGDPKAQVQALLDSGRMTQAQYNQIQAMARQLIGMMQ